MDLYANKFKYPRTRHVHWSRSVGDDDKVHPTLAQFEGREIVVTEKMDGENTSMYRDHYHARSLDSRNHPSRNAVKAIWGSIRYLIPEGYRICGENLYAEHSIRYTDLDSYFYGFSIWNDENVALSWDDTLAKFKEWGITPVRELYRGPFNEKILMDLLKDADLNRIEGWVMRVVDKIPYEEFGNLVGKFVRTGHVQTDEHWMTKAIVPNQLKGGYASFHHVELNEKK